MPDPSVNPGEAKLPDPAVRSVVSLLLFAHLFMLVVALSSYMSPSELQQRLVRVVSPYVRTLNFDLAHPYYWSARLHWTLETRSDVDYSILVDVKRPDGPVETVLMPPADLWPHQRYLRYQAVANVAGTLAESQAPSESELPKSITASILAERGATKGTVRCQAHFLPSLENMQGGPKAGERLTSTIYEADVILIRGAVELLKKSSAAEVAPVEKKP